MSKIILIIDDNNDFRESAADILSDNHFDVYEATCPKNAFEILLNDEVDLILCDLNMPFTDENAQAEFISGNKVGLETIKELGWAFPKTPIIAISAASSWELVEAAKTLGDIKIIRKPVSPRMLLQEVSKTFVEPIHTEYGTVLPIEH